MKSFTRRLLLGIAFVATAWAAVPTLLVHGQAAARDEMVPMRDGTRLAVSLYFPAGTGPWPVVLTRTPYGKDQGEPAKAEARYMANGYVRVVQDSRGKGKSEGVYRPFADDLEDGYDTIEWQEGERVEDAFLEDVVPAADSTRRRPETSGARPTRGRRNPLRRRTISPRRAPSSRRGPPDTSRRRTYTTRRIRRQPRAATTWGSNAARWTSAPSARARTC